jgi:16S rRNA (cytosine1402-N4)-methyltransferase
MKHIPVLLDKVLETLGDINGKTVVDCTFGAGGYGIAFLNAGANVIAFDRDSSVCETAEKFKSEYGGKFEFINKPFSAINSLPNKYDAIVFDFGVSSMQIDTAQRGFSFRFDGPLDMRMGNVGQTAAELIKNSSIADLAKILRDFGDIKKSGMFATIIKDALPVTTFELKELIHNPKDVAPIFQALRIAVNDELSEIERALGYVPQLLNMAGKCICVTFHSLEDRIVKSVFHDWTTPLGDPRLPQIDVPKFNLLKTFKPSPQDIENNMRARSAHMRGVKKSY